MERLARYADQLTPGERILAARRRAKMTQREMADWFGVSPRVFSAWEKDERADVPEVFAPPLSPGEVCFFLRRRSGTTVATVAKSLGLSVRWVQRAEAGESRNLEPLLGYWRACLGI